MFDSCALHAYCREQLSTDTNPGYPNGGLPHATGGSRQIHVFSTLVCSHAIGIISQQRTPYMPCDKAPEETTPPMMLGKRPKLIQPHPRSSLPFLPPLGHKESNRTEHNEKQIRGRQKKV